MFNNRGNQESVVGCRLSVAAAVAAGKEDWLIAPVAIGGLDDCLPASKAGMIG